MPAVVVDSGVGAAEKLLFAVSCRSLLWLSALSTRNKVVGGVFSFC